jgi:hypothetical protein
MLIDLVMDSVLITAIYLYGILLVLAVGPHGDVFAKCVIDLTAVWVFTLGTYVYIEGRKENAAVGLFFSLASWIFICIRAVKYYKQIAQTK